MDGSSFYVTVSFTHPTKDVRHRAMSFLSGHSVASWSIVEDTNKTLTISLASWLLPDFYRAVRRGTEQ